MKQSWTTPPPARQFSHSGAGADHSRPPAIAFGEAAASMIRPWNRDLAQGFARRTFQPVRRGSYDVNDSRAQVFRPIADGSPGGGLRWAEKLVRTAQEYDDTHKPFGRRMGPLGDSAIRILDTLLTRCCDFATGRCEPSIDTLMRYTRYARATVVDALERLRRHGFLDWVRRTRWREDAGEAGPRVAQTSNAYCFTLTALASKAKQRFIQLLGGRRAAEEARRQQQAEREHEQYLARLPASELGSAIATADPELAAALNRLGAALEASEAAGAGRPDLHLSASSVTELNPPPGSRKKME